MKRALPFVLVLFAAGCQGSVAPSKPPPTTTPSAVAPQAPAVPELTSKDIDAALRAEWTKQGVTPSAPADDATYLRRVYIDVVGTLPPPDKVTSFAADASPDKRAKVVEDLLASPAYADHWTAYWDDQLMGNTRMGDIDRQQLRVWIHDEFSRNVSWDKIVYELITATGVNSAGGKYQKTLTEARNESDDDERIDGAVNYVLKFRDTPQDFAGSASKTFLGVQIQCAQCHDHKTETWKQVDFQKFAACFTRAQTVPVGDKDMKGIKTVMVRDINRPLPRFAKNADLTPIIEATPTALDGTPLDGNVRQAVAHWITKNPWFAQESVNRAWGHFLGRGFVNPVDDLRPSNPPVMGALMDTLAKDFALHGYDPKRLIRLITQSEAYGLSPTPPAAPANTNAKTDAREIPLWSRFRLTPLGPEELVNALVGATGVEDALSRMTRTDLEDLRVRLTALFSFAFDVDEELDKPGFEGTITQALVLLNGKLAVGGTSALPGTALGAIARNNGSDADKITLLYLRTVSRKPTQEELDAALDYVAHAPAPGDAPDAAPAPTPPVEAKGKAKAKSKAKAKGKGKGKGQGQDPLRRLEGVPRSHDPKVAALEDIMWALINSSEFVFNH